MITIQQVTEDNVLHLMLLSDLQPMTDEEKEFFMVGEGNAYLGFYDDVGFILDADSAVAVFDKHDDECRFNWFMTRKVR
jgi:hypothetical protein